jgi:hypothetical protein
MPSTVPILYGPGKARINLKTIMKSYLHIFSLLLLSVFTFSCSKDDSTPIQNNPTDGLNLIQTLQNATHQLELFSPQKNWEQGYNEMFVRVKNLDGSLIENAEITWQATMHMTSMSHSCPIVQPKQSSDRKGFSQGAFVFQMASNDSEYWEININYTVKGQQYSVSGRVNVLPANLRKVSVFKGSDNQKYVLALLPQKPKVGVNEIKALLFKMESMTLFTPLSGYTVKIDPRMPGMGNHGSPNNVDLTTSNDSNLYQGKLNLSMTGYWKINLQVLNASGTLLKGETIDGAVEASSIYWEIEF